MEISICPNDRKAHSVRRTYEDISFSNVPDFIVYHGDLFAMDAGNAQVVQMRLSVNNIHHVLEFLNAKLSQIQQLIVFPTKICVIIFLTAKWRMMNTFAHGKEFCHTAL